MSYRRIDIPQARELMKTRDAKVIDVRDPSSYAAGHIVGAEHVNDGNVATFMQGANPKLPLIVCCYHGNMSQSAAEYFSRQGFEETYSLDGGYEAWRMHSLGALYKE